MMKVQLKTWYPRSILSYVKNLTGLTREQKKFFLFIEIIVKRVKTIIYVNKKLAILCKVQKLAF